MKIYISDNTFNSQEEFYDYISDPSEIAEDDHIYDVRHLVVGFRRIYARLTDGTRRIFPRHTNAGFASVAIDYGFTEDEKQFKAIAMHGENFLPIDFQIDDAEKRCTMLHGKDFFLLRFQ